jgi:hypothetical protein
MTIWCGDGVREGALEVATVLPLVMMCLPATRPFDLARYAT